MGFPLFFSGLEMSDVDASPAVVVDDDEDDEIVPEASQQCKHIHRVRSAHLSPG